MVVSYSRVRCVCVVHQSNNVQDTIRQLYAYTHTIGGMLHWLPGAKLYSCAVLVLLQSRYRGILNIPPILRYLFPLLPDVVNMNVKQSPRRWCPLQCKIPFCSLLAVCTRHYSGKTLPEKTGCLLENEMYVSGNYNRPEVSQKTSLIYCAFCNAGLLDIFWGLCCPTVDWG